MSSYERLIFRMQCLLIALIKADRMAREETFKPKGKKANVTKIPIPPPMRPDFLEGVTITYIDIPEYWHEQEAELTTFWRTKWQPRPATEGTGTTWLEFDVTYRFWGGDSKFNTSRVN